MKLEGTNAFETKDKEPVVGLFAVDNDMQSIQQGRYPGPGTTLGPTLTFGSLLGRHLSAK